MLEQAYLEQMSKVQLCQRRSCSSCHLLSHFKFNDGDISFLKLFNDLDITLDIFPRKGTGDCDDSRINLSAKKSTEIVKKRRKVLRHLRKHYIDSIEKKSVSYEAGAF